MTRRPRAPDARSCRSGPPFWVVGNIDPVSPDALSWRFEAVCAVKLCQALEVSPGVVGFRHMRSHRGSGRPRSREALHASPMSTVALDRLGSCARKGPSSDGTTARFSFAHYGGPRSSARVDFRRRDRSGRIALLGARSQSSEAFQSKSPRGNISSGGRNSCKPSPTRAKDCSTTTTSCSP